MFADVSERGSAHAEARLRDLRREVAWVADDETDEAGLIDRIGELERLKSAVAAAQARLTARLHALRARREALAGIPARERCRGLSAEIALARGVSPRQGGQHLGLARALVEEMPHTLAALARGEVSEWRATLLVRETAVLTSAHRAAVDVEIADDLPDLGDRAVVAEARRLGCRLDPGSALRRIRGAEGDRRVGIRPAPDTMTYLTGHLPVAQGVACWAALTRHADTLRSQGDLRTRAQIMADTMVTRLTGQATAEGVGVEVRLVMTDASLFGPDTRRSAGDLVRAATAPARSGDEAALLEDGAVIPGAVARRLVREAPRAWVRRLYASPRTGQLVAMDSHRRVFAGGLREFLIVRDQWCRTPWCNAPIRHADHIRPVADGGPTTADNGQGLCEACNHAKEAPGWTTRRLPTSRHTTEITTPTGHTYRSRAPDPPGRSVTVTDRTTMHLDLWHQPRVATA